MRDDMQEEREYTLKLPGVFPVPLATDLQSFVQTSFHAVITRQLVLRQIEQETTNTCGKMIL